MSESTCPSPVSEIEPTMMPASAVATAIVVILFAAVTIAQKISSNPIITSSRPTFCPIASFLTGS